MFMFDKIITDHSNEICSTLICMFKNMVCGRVIIKQVVPAQCSCQSCIYAFTETS